jgi:hypothetical protein
MLPTLSSFLRDEIALAIEKEWMNLCSDSYCEGYLTCEKGQDVSEHRDPSGPVRAIDGRHPSLCSLNGAAILPEERRKSGRKRSVRLGDRMSQQLGVLIASLSLIDGVVIVLLTAAALAILGSWIIWRTSSVLDQLVAGTLLGAAAGGLIGVFHGGMPLGMLLGADAGWACLSIWYVLRH